MPSWGVAFSPEGDISFLGRRDLSLLEIIQGCTGTFRGQCGPDTICTSTSIFLTPNNQRIVKWRTRLRIVILC
jgi:hypothetical protein